MLAAHKCLAKAWQAQGPLAPGRRGGWGHWERRRDIQTRWEIQNASAAPAIKRVCLKRGNARLSFELHSRQTQSCFLDNRSLQTSAWDLNRSSGRSGQMFGKHPPGRNAFGNLWLNVLFAAIDFSLRNARHRSAQSISPPACPFFPNSTSMMWNKGESGVYYLAISVSRAPLQVKQMEQVCVPVSFRPDLHSSSSSTAPHPWRILLLIAVNRNMERLWSLRGLMACWVHLTLIAFFFSLPPLSPL